MENNIQELKNLNKLVNNLNKNHHKKIFDIILNNNIQYSENRNGIFINLNKLPLNVINEIKKYIEYISIQEKNISNYENIKNEFKKDFFKNIENEDKDNTLVNNKVRFHLSFLKEMGFTFRLIINEIKKNKPDIRFVVDSNKVPR